MVMGKRISHYFLYSIGLIVLLSGSLSGFADSDTYEVESIAVNAIVDEKYQIQVTEELEMMFYTGKDSLTRTIPLLVNDQRFEVDQISGVGIEIHPTWKRDEVILTIKKSSGEFSGLEKFHLEYVISGGRDQEADSDPFFLSIIAPDWNTYINHADFSIELPIRVLPEMLVVDTTIGQVVSRDTMVVSLEGNHILGESQYFLVPGEAVSIGIQLPEGTFSGAEELRTFYEETEGWGYGVTFGALLMAFGWWFWSKEKRKEAALRMDPPPKASPSEISYLFTKKVEIRDFSILLIEWANRGWIHIYPNFSGMGGNEGAVITLERRPPQETNAYELRFFNLLFDEYGNGHRVRLEDLRGRFARHFDEVKVHMRAEHGLGTRAFYKNNQTKDTIGLTFFASLPIIFFWIRVMMENLHGWLGAILSFVLLVIQMIAIRWVEIGDRGSKRIFGFFFLGLLAALSIYFGRVFGFLMTLGSAGLILYLTKRSEEKTVYGIERIQQYQGYRKFLQGLEKEELLEMIQHAPDLFYYGLPYAERLGVLNEWKKPFKEIFLLAPIWYHGEESNQFSIEEFTQKILSFLTHFEEVLESGDS